MKKLLIALAIVASLAVLSSCAATQKSMREPNVRIELNSKDYTLSEPKTAEAYVTRIFMIDWEHLFDSKTANINASIFSSYLPSGDEGYAIYKILEENPGYDFVMYPQVTTETKSYIIYSTTKVTVTARLGKFNK